MAITIQISQTGEVDVLPRFVYGSSVNDGLATITSFNYLRTTYALGFNYLPTDFFFINYLGGNGFFFADILPNGDITLVPFEPSLNSDSIAINLNLNADFQMTNPTKIFNIIGFASVGHKIILPDPTAFNRPFLGQPFWILIQNQPAVTTADIYQFGGITPVLTGIPNGSLVQVELLNEVPGTYQANIISFPGIVPVLTQNIYVSPEGSDITGTGTVTNPYATYNHAVLSITDASSIKPYGIVFTAGKYVETIFLIKPWVNIAGTIASSLTFDSISLDPVWLNADTHETLIEGLTLIPTMDITYDFSTSLGFNVLAFNDVAISANSFNINYIANGNCVVVYFNVLDLGATNNHNFTNIGLHIGIGFVTTGNINIINNTLVSPTQMIYSASEIGLNFSAISAVGSSINIVLGSTVINGTNTLTGVGTILSASIESFSSVPILIGGATYSLVTIAEGLNANFIPVNYTPTGTHNDVKGHLQGIDIELGVLSPLTTKGDIYTYSTAPARLPIGPDGTIIEADATQVTGNGWTASLKDALLISSVLFQSRLLQSSTSVTTLNWQLARLFDTTGLLAADWNIRALYGNNGTSVVVDWDGQQLMDTAGFGAMIWSSSNRQLIDDVGNLAINFTAGDRRLYATGGINFTVDWDVKGLYDSNVFLSWDWENRIGYDSGPLPSINYNLRQLFWTDGSTAVVDWSDQSITDQNGGISIRWFDRQLFDATTAKSMDWDSRQGFHTDGTTATLEWGVQLLIDIGGGNSLNWQTRELINSSGDTTASWEGQTLSDNAGSIILDWNQRQQFSTSGVLSIDWLARNLVALDGATVALDWSNVLGIAVKGLRVSEAANGKQGIATLVAGIVTVANTSITANSRIFLTAQDNNSVGSLRISARTAGVNFTITSSVNTDNGVVAYEIFEPA